MEPKNSVSWLEAEGLYELKPLKIDRLSGQSDQFNLQSPFAGVSLNTKEIVGCFYSNTSHNEAKVLTLRGKNSRVLGYLMRATAAFSKDVGYSEEEWFKKAAVLTGFWALQHIANTLMRPATSGPIDPEELFSDSVSVLILDKEDALSNGIEFIGQLDTQLFSFGFKRLREADESSWSPGKHASNKLAALDKNLRIEPTPRHPPHQRFLEKVFTTYIPGSTLPLARFFYFYQIIELLMEEIAEESLTTSLAKLAEFKTRNDSSSFRKETTQLQQIFKESTRINRVFTLVDGVPIEFSLLKEISKTTLLSIGSTEPTNAADGIYSIRNQIFHNYRVAGDSFETYLPEINELLEVVVTDLLIAVLVNKRHIAIDRDSITIVSNVHESDLLPRLFSFDQ